VTLIDLFARAHPDTTQDSILTPNARQQCIFFLLYALFAHATLEKNVGIFFPKKEMKNYLIRDDQTVTFRNNLLR
jgi:hypothetical protein